MIDHSIKRLRAFYLAPKLCFGAHTNDIYLKEYSGCVTDNPFKCK
jgi:hypothetical protein